MEEKCPWCGSPHFIYENEIWPSAHTVIDSCKCLECEMYFEIEFEAKVRKIKKIIFQEHNKKKKLFLASFFLHNHFNALPR